MLTTKQSKLLKRHPLSCVIKSKAIAHYQNTKWLDSIYFSYFFSDGKDCLFQISVDVIYYLFWFKVKGFIWGTEAKCHVVNIYITSASVTCWEKNRKMIFLNCDINVSFIHLLFFFLPSSFWSRQVLVSCTFVFIWYQNLLGRENIMVFKSIFTEFVSKFLFFWVWNSSALIINYVSIIKQLFYF